MDLDITNNSEILVSQFVYGQQYIDHFDKWFYPINNVYCNLHKYTYHVEKLKYHNQEKKIDMVIGKKLIIYNV